MSTLAKLPNVGKVLESHLLAIGIETPEQLLETGSREAFLRIRLERDPGACLHMLYGIEGAIEGVHDRFLPEATKKELRNFYNHLNSR